MVTNLNYETFSTQSFIETLGYKIIFLPLLGVIECIIYIHHSFTVEIKNQAQFLICNSSP